MINDECFKLLINAEKSGQYNVFFQSNEFLVHKFNSDHSTDYTLQDQERADAHTAHAGPVWVAWLMACTALIS